MIRRLTTWLRRDDHRDIRSRTIRSGSVFSWTRPELHTRLERLRNQHDLMASILRQAGGSDAVDKVPKGSSGKIADVVFEGRRLIVEVKSLTTDRRTSPAVKERLGTIVHEGSRHGGPIAYGTVSIRLDQLLPETGSRALREIGDRVLKEVREANKQIAATAEKLGWEAYHGAVGFIAPPAIMRRDVIGWLVHDALKEGKYPRVNCLIIGSTPFLGAPGATGDSFLSFHSRDGYDLGLTLKRKIGRAWAEAHRSPWREVSPDELDELSSAS